MVQKFVTGLLSNLELTFDLTKRNFQLTVTNILS